MEAVNFRLDIVFFLASADTKTIIFASMFRVIIVINVLLVEDSVAVRYRRAVVVVWWYSVWYLPSVVRYQEEEVVQDPSSSVRRPFVVPKLLAHPFFFWHTLFFDNQPCSTWDIVYQIGFPSV